MTVVLPGDRIALPSGSSSGSGSGSSASIKLGPGLLPSQASPSSSRTWSPTLTAIRAGALGHIEANSSSKLRTKEADAYWVETNTQRYVPSPGDAVVGQITNRGAESYTVSLFSAHSATLPALSFEGATKRHKPNLKIGSLVYARVVSADRFTEPELTCVNPVTGKSDGFGDLKTTDERGERNGSAMLFRVSLGLARSLLRPNQNLLKHVAGQFPFEAAIGQNGAVWIRASSAKHVVAVGKVLQAADQIAVSHSTTESHAGAGAGADADAEAESDIDIDMETVRNDKDADWILRHRASWLDAKTVRAIVQEIL
ncbi:hypothetical protein BCV70DRAFT_200785 [Testicularia cyperi]|uniref:Ribosomal RNA-processing protein 40 n=1 Tax=Testicularia cyperi TaxID=1882483 RepID=A0A317XP49_9BASI|nr:hypothetical protein BCV70DRAFT_200785 [Testicularia cyperi]